jgi:WD40 repeat protein
MSGDGNSKIKIWNMNASACMLTLSGHESYVYGLVELKNGNIISSSGDITIKIWEVDDIMGYKCVSTFNEHTNIVFTLIKLANENVVSSSGDKTIKI